MVLCGWGEQMLAGNWPLAAEMVGIRENEALAQSDHARGV
jgi:hypothetical protein